MAPNEDATTVSVLLARDGKQVIEHELEVGVFRPLLRRIALQAERCVVQPDVMFVRALLVCENERTNQSCERMRADKPRRASTAMRWLNVSDPDAARKPLLQR